MIGRVQLRAAEAGDATEIGKIWSAGWRDGHLRHVPDELVAARTPESFLSRAVERVGDTTVAAVDSMVAGFVMVLGDEVEQVYVSSAHRGTGTASVLLTAAEHRVTANGHRRAWLAVVAGNDRARRFYTRNGWRDEGPFDYVAGGVDNPITVSAHRYTKDVRASAPA
ncbi:MAG: GNAT family N-acetyltransferase [Actinomycetia bacterium]|nr:GNAT family N-acetyltransferase [Actinomycetes bacterium]